MIVVLVHISPSNCIKDCSLIIKILSKLYGRFLGKNGSMRTVHDVCGDDIVCCF